MFVKNKVALITGGASGLGLCYAIELLRNGLKGVTLADVDAAKGDEAVAQITEEFGPNRVIFVKTDVTDKTQLENAFKQTVDRFKNLDIVINNAGVMNDRIWEKEIAINLNGTIHGCILAMEEYLPKYKSSDEGVIVNVASVLGLDAVEFFPIYSATKHAVIGLSKSLSLPEQYNATKVRVLTICPGTTATPLLDDIHEKMLNQRYVDILLSTRASAAKEYPRQSVDPVIKCMTKIIEEGQTGSVWVVEADEIYEIELPRRKQMKKV